MGQNFRREQTMSDGSDTQDGGCACSYVRYRVESRPLIVHCCHCSWCQRQNGSAFAVNALVEADRVTILNGQVIEIEVPSPSGASQRIARCPKCQVAVWSYYLAMPGGIGNLIRFIRAGTLDDPDKTAPDVHIFTSSKQAWVVLPPDALTFKEYYITEEVWPKASLERRAALLKAVQNNNRGRTE